MEPRTLEELTRRICHRMNDDNHAVILVWGRPGTGKSEGTTLWLRKIDPKFSPRKQTVFGEASAVQLSQRLGKKRAIHCDEGGEGGNKRRAMSGANVDVQDYLDKARKLNQCWVFIRPNVADFDKAILYHGMWGVEFLERGRFRVYRIEQSGFYGGKPYFQRLFEDRMPNPMEVNPELIAEYREVVHEHLHGAAVGRDEAFRHEVERLRLVIREEMARL